MTLGTFLEEFIKNRKSANAFFTLRNHDQARKQMVEYFGADCDLRGITTDAAERWLRDLEKRYAPASIGRLIRRARQFFKVAMNMKLVTENPFLSIKSSDKINKNRQFHVSREVIERVIAAAPDAEWRLLIALSRYGGLRCPSEHLALRWQDVNWERNRFLVNSSKTGERWVPLFSELRQHLEECFEMAQPGAVHVITRYRDPNSNLRTTFQKIIKRAGERPWPKLFHNLRGSRQTELAAKYPIHVTCAWLGLSLIHI